MSVQSSFIGRLQNRFKANGPGFYRRPAKKKKREPQRQVVITHRWDDTAWKRARETDIIDSDIQDLFVGDLEAINAGDEEARYGYENAPELVRDIWSLLYKPYGRLRPRKEILKDAWFNRLILEEIQSNPQFQLLQQKCSLDAVTTTMATDSMMEAVKEILTRKGEARDDSNTRRNPGKYPPKPGQKPPPGGQKQPPGEKKEPQDGPEGEGPTGCGPTGPGGQPGGEQQGGDGQGGEQPGGEQGGQGQDGDGNGPEGQQQAPGEQAPGGGSGQGDGEGETGTQKGGPKSSKPDKGDEPEDQDAEEGDQDGQGDDEGDDEGQSQGQGDDETDPDDWGSEGTGDDEDEDDSEGDGSESSDGSDGSNGEESDADGSGEGEAGDDERLADIDKAWEEAQAEAEEREDNQRLADMLDDDDSTDLERLLHRAVNEAIDEIGELEKVRTGVGLEDGEWKTMDPTKRWEYAERFRTPQMKALAEIVGRMIRFAMGCQATKINDVPHEIYDVTNGDDIMNTLQSELALLATPESEIVFFQRMIDKELLVYKKRGTEEAGKGPIVMAIDKSGSMNGAPFNWAMAVSEALRRICADQDRDYYALFFGNNNDRNRFWFPKGKPQESWDEVFAFLSCVANGGTEFDGVLTEALERVQTQFDNDGEGKADIVFVTDGQAHLDPDWIKKFNEEKERIGCKCYGVFVGGASDYRGGTNRMMEFMRLFCDEVIPVAEFKPESVREIFSRV